MMMILLGILPVLSVLAVIIAAPILLMIVLGFRDPHENDLITWVFGIAFLCVVAAVIATAHFVGTWMFAWWAR